ncbi:hypothetical protein ACFQPF_09500 [Fictibacillus iocasae]|uniref:Uncharacterized protein n=1 Tax=Fictibacillus iocasae TaxID=2715437 RepID=A0ABW2NRW0_9BACL
MCVILLLLFLLHTFIPLEGWLAYVVMVLAVTFVITLLDYLFAHLLKDKNREVSVVWNFVCITIFMLVSFTGI